MGEGQSEREREGGKERKEVGGEREGGREMVDRWRKVDTCCFDNCIIHNYTTVKQ